MKSIKFFSIFILVFLIFFTFTKNSFAAVSSVQNPETIYRNTPSISFILTSNSGDILPNRVYSFGIWQPGDTDDSTNFPIKQFTSDSQANRLVITMSLSGSGLQTPGTWRYKVWLGTDLVPNQQSLIFSGQYTIYNCDNLDDKGCPALVLYQQPTTYQATKPVEVGIRNVRVSHTYSVWFEGAKKIPTITANNQFIENGLPTYKFTIDAPDVAGSYKLCLSESVPNFGGFSFTGGFNCDFFFGTPILIIGSAPTNVTPTIAESNQAGIPTFTSGSLHDVPLLYCAEGETENGTIIKKKDYTMQEWEEKSKTIEKCLTISTAIGDISTNPAEFIQRIFSLVLGLAGGIALILIILAGYRFMASQGDPEKVVEARQQLTAAIVGLLFIIFSFVILQVIGVDILKIPGFE